VRARDVDTAGDRVSSARADCRSLPAWVLQVSGECRRSSRGDRGRGHGIRTVIWDGLDAATSGAAVLDLVDTVAKFDWPLIFPWLVRGRGTGVAANSSSVGA
jgi:hypothetical protein